MQSLALKKMVRKKRESQGVDAKMDKSLTIQFVPLEELSSLQSTKRVNKVLKMVKADKIIVLEGILKPDEEAELIKRTMQEVDENFKGIELATIQPEKAKTFKDFLAQVLLGVRRGLTVIGPASIVREIKKDPEKIQLFMDVKHLHK